MPNEINWLKVEMPLHLVDAYPQKQCRVFVEKAGRNAWVAAGRFMREHLAAKGRSELGALAEWKNLAEFRYELGHRHRVRRPVRA